jgi:two-component system, OmpR family, sensor histidine kinase BaeS
MPRKEQTRFHRRDWFDASDSAGTKPGAPASPEEWQQRVARFRPPWWPENEPWPPRDRHWRRSTHRPFFRLFGCAFLLLSIVGAAFFVAVIVLALNALGATAVGLREARWVVPGGALLLLILITTVIVAGANLRRMSAPLDDILAASHRVAEGDYEVRVAPHGPPEVRSLASAFNSMAEQLQAHDGQRRSMLADVTHELRTPLTIIQGNLEGILDGVYPPDEARLKSILEETQILSRLTDDLRTLSLAESGTLQLKREQTDLVALAGDVIAAFQSQADMGGVRIELSASQADILLNIDPERIRQVLGNLISNAVRYSARGSTVTVRISGSPGVIAIAVADSGAGISAADLPHIFDRYYKSADSRGMGLGLSIARYIVEAHGGTISAESPSSGGTTISFTLPA